jgi:hypothetical protein
MANGEWRVANDEAAIRHSPFATRYSLLAAIRYSPA